MVLKLSCLGKFSRVRLRCLSPLLCKVALFHMTSSQGCRFAVCISQQNSRLLEEPHTTILGPMFPVNSINSGGPIPELFLWVASSPATVLCSLRKTTQGHSQSVVFCVPDREALQPGTHLLLPLGFSGRVSRIF